MKKYFFPLLLMSLFACELIVDVEVPFEHAQLTLNTFFNPDSVWEVDVSLNRHILSDTPFQKIENALLVIYDGDSPVDTLKHQGNGNYRSDTGRPQTGKTYVIRATADGYDPVSAQSHSPSPAQITRVDVTFPEPEPNGFRHAKIDITFTDAAQEQNFYQIFVHVERQYIDRNSGRILTTTTPVSIESNDPAFDENQYVNSGILIKDILFNGKETELSFKTLNADISAYSKVVITLRTISEDLYKYKTTRQLQENTSGDPFAQPVNVFSNIENGFGIFAGYSQSSFTLNNAILSPVITGFSPAKGKPGDHVIISGENFGENPSNYYTILFNGSQYPVYARSVSSSDTQIEVIVPETAITGKIYYQGRIGVAISDDEFEVIR
jgi:hypothetical protein